MQATLERHLRILLKLSLGAVNPAGAAEEGEQRDGGRRGSGVRQRLVQHDGDAPDPAEDPRRCSWER